MNYKNFQKYLKLIDFIKELDNSYKEIGEF